MWLGEAAGWCGCLLRRESHVASRAASSGHGCARFVRCAAMTIKSIDPGYGLWGPISRCREDVNANRPDSLLHNRRRK